MQRHQEAQLWQILTAGFLMACESQPHPVDSDASAPFPDMTVEDLANDRDTDLAPDSNDVSFDCNYADASVDVLSRSEVAADLGPPDPDGAIRSWVRPEITSVSVGLRAACAVRAGLMYCWGLHVGRNRFDTDADGLMTLSPQLVPPLINVRSVVVGDGALIALLNTGDVYHWGYITPRFPPAESDPAPRLIEGLTDVVDISRSGDGYCVVRRDGSVWCWGTRNPDFALGRADCSDFWCLNPLAVEGVSDAISVSMSADHGCAVLRDHTVMCWGGNLYGQLGIGAVGERQAAYGSLGVPHAVRVPGVTDVRQVMAGSHSTCALRFDGTVLCWGSDRYGQTGDGPGSRGACSTLSVTDRFETQPCTLSPTLVPGLRDVIVLEGSSYCGIKIDGSVWCWGIGDVDLYVTHPEIPFYDCPVQVPGLSNVASTSQYIVNECIVTRSDEIYCAGENDYGQLGIGTTDAVLHHMTRVTLPP